MPGVQAWGIVKLYMLRFMDFNVEPSMIKIGVTTTVVVLSLR